MKNLSLKRSFVSILTVFGTTLSLGSCASSTSTPSNNNNSTSCGEGILCATIDGASYVADAYNPAGDPTSDKSAGSFAILQDPYYGYSFHLGINGDKALHPQQSIEIGITANSIPAVGTAYDLTSSTVGISLDYYKFDATDLVLYDWRADRNHAGATGTLTITKLDTVTNLVSGMFSFSAKEININTTHDSSTVTVTDGSFTDLRITR